MAERQYLWLTAESCKSSWTQSDTDRGLIVSANGGDDVSTFSYPVYEVFFQLECHEPLRVIQCSIYEVQMHACDRYNS